jgi:hypothetical protein
MYSTINTYRNDSHRDDLAALAAERRLARSAQRRESGRPAEPGPAERSFAAGREAMFALCAVLALLVAIAVPVVTVPLV